jgi:hypothetical protein
MAKFLTISLFCMMVLASTATFAQPALDTLAACDELVPNEVSALLLSRDFSDAIAVQTRKARSSNEEIRIARFDVLKFETSTYVYAFLATRPIGASDWKTAGQLVGNVSYSPSGTAIITGVFFKPDAEGPGGASVGN